MRPLLAHKAVGKITVDFSVTNVGTAAWVQISAAFPAPCVALEIFNATGTTFKVSNGAPGAEDAGELPFYILPGGDAPALIPMEISKNKPISLKAVDIAVNSSRLTMNLYG